MIGDTWNKGLSELDVRFIIKKLDGGENTYNEFCDGMSAEKGVDKGAGIETEPGDGHKYSSMDV